MNDEAIAVQTTPEAITINISQGQIDSLLSEPDWEEWRSRGTAGLPEAVMLSINIEPRTWKDFVHPVPGKRFKPFADGSGFVEFVLGATRPPLGRVFTDRLTMAENHFPGALDQSRGAIVSLSEFADWLVSKRLSMPNELAEMASIPVPEDLLLATDSEPEEAYQTRPQQASRPCVTKSELIDVLDLVGGTWESRLKIPSKGIDHYKPARLDPGRKGQGAGNQSTWDPVVFTRIAVEQKHLNKVAALTKFKKAWSKWQDELEAEMGEL